ncbi:hypothetical protein MMC06_002196 [Schaereria dolodes]|nr:hypothetical protein [Schaereria dolodes]
MSTEPVAGGGHMMSPDDADNPFNWPLYRRVYVSAVAVAFAFSITFGATTYTAGITGVMADFNVSMTVAILPFSLYFFGIAFAPVITPHLTERLGRSGVYLISLPLFMLFLLGSGLARNFATLAICRFFAGFFGGPCLVLIEGTFADVWRAHTTVSYYAILTLGPYIGAATGPLVGGFVFAGRGWKWTQWVPLMFAFGVYLFGLGMNETYNRSIIVRRATRHGVTAPRLADAQSGVTLRDMCLVTVVTPASQMVSEPIVIFTSIYLGFNWGVIFSFFISIPVVLKLTYAFTIQQAGLAFIAAIVGAILAGVTTLVTDMITYRVIVNKGSNGMVAIEYRLIPAMLGGFLMTASLFWIAWTANPKINWAAPVIGTLVYVWGNMSILISFISYLFDAYPARGTLSALTAAAVFRIVLAGVFPLFIIQMIVNLTGAWAYSTFGFISAVMFPIPFILFKYGARLRASSKHAGPTMLVEEKSMSKPVDAEMGAIDKGAQAL